ncbi:MAG: K+-sensing histidine kinase KdpD [bacterium]|jgi:K+-sensing histidine kinase KdpD
MHMEFSQESFDFLKKRNTELEKQIKSNKEFSKIHWLNESQFISQVGSWKWDIKNNKVEWSDMMYILLGLEPNGQPPSYELALYHVHDDDKATYESYLAKSMNNKKEYYFENRIIKKDKSIINVISRGVCICNEENDLIGMRGTIQDITRLKQLIETTNQLEEITQLEHFANILSHDFKTPIRTIVSFIGLIKKKSFEDLTEEGKRYFSFVESGARRLSALVNDILEYSKLSSPELRVVKVSTKELVKDILLDLNIIIVEKKSIISTGWLPESIYVDRIKIRRVLQNLISNAIKYTSPNIKPEIDIYCEEDENKFIFYIKDNGIGVEKEYIDKIFEPYIRVNTEKHFSGTGIGLSICKQIIKLHNGDIGHFANKDKGSCFYFTIPK